MNIKIHTSSNIPYWPYVTKNENKEDRVISFETILRRKRNNKWETLHIEESGKASPGSRVYFEDLKEEVMKNLISQAHCFLNLDVVGGWDEDTLQMEEDERLKEIFVHRLPKLNVT